MRAAGKTTALIGTIEYHLGDLVDSELCLVEIDARFLPQHFARRLRAIDHDAEVPTVPRDVRGARARDQGLRRDAAVVDAGAAEQLAFHDGDLHACRGEAVRWGGDSVMPYAAGLAVEVAGVVRFRPMLLTASAVVVGSAVMLADPIFQGLAISMMAGEVAATLLYALANPHGALSIVSVVGGVDNAELNFAYTT